MGCNVTKPSSKPMPKRSMSRVQSTASPTVEAAAIDLVLRPPRTKTVVNEETITPLLVAHSHSSGRRTDLSSLTEGEDGDGAAGGGGGGVHSLWLRHGNSYGTTTLSRRGMRGGGGGDGSPNGRATTPSESDTIDDGEGTQPHEHPDGGTSIATDKRELSVASSCSVTFSETALVLTDLMKRDPSLDVKGPVSHRGERDEGDELLPVDTDHFAVSSLEQRQQQQLGRQTTTRCRIGDALAHQPPVEFMADFLAEGSLGEELVFVCQPGVFEVPVTCPGTPHGSQRARLRQAGRSDKALNQ